MERYFRIARNNVEVRPTKLELNPFQWGCVLWNEANEMSWKECDKLPEAEQTYEQQEAITDKYIAFLEHSAETYVDWNNDHTAFHIEGGIDIGDYTYYKVTDDELDLYDISRRN